MAKIDIVVPCYNYGRFLPMCVGSVLSQSVADVRVLIIDDASRDNSVQWARELADADPRIQLIAHPTNRGHIETYNEGIAWASSDYFMVLSADDLLVPGALQRAVDIMDANADIVLTYGDVVEWRDTAPLPAVAPGDRHSWSRFDLLEATCSAGKNLVPTPTVIVRTAAQKEVGGYRKSLPHAGDMEMWLRFAAVGAVARVDAVQAIYRKHSTAMSNAYYATALGDHRQVQLAFDTFFNEYAPRLNRAQDKRDRARRALASRTFQQGLRVLRRGHFGVAAKLISYAIQMDRRLAFKPPLGLLFKPPGPVGRDWAISIMLGARDHLSWRLRGAWRSLSRSRAT